jgi:hypothetical protein
MSVIISNLPSYTGTAADLRWFVMNNSGETTTYKYSGYSSPFRYIASEISILASWLPLSNVTGNYNMAGGDNVQIINDNSSFAWGKNLLMQNGGETGKAMFGTGCQSNGGGNNLTFGTSATNNAYYSICGGEFPANYGNGSAVFGRANTNNAGRSFIAGNLNVNNGDTSFIFSESSTINGGSYSAILGGNNSTISGGTNVVMLGTSGRTGLYDNTTHVENSHNFKTESFGVTNVGSVGGSINVDCSLGTLFYFTITANTTPNFINWKEGQRIQFWVDNSGSFTVPTATITGGGSVYAKSGSLNPTNNEITAYYGTIVNGNMFLDEHLNFQPV